MARSPLPRGSQPPLNPDVRDLVENHRRWSSPLKIETASRGFRGWHERGFLPHRDEPGLTQFVTFHVADSFPESRRAEWEPFAEIANERERRKKIEAYLDQSRGACPLRRTDLAELVEDNFRRYSGPRYDLLAWVVMPNHVHVLFRVHDVPMSEIVGDWKKHTGRLANQILSKRGAFWAEDYFDVFMRDAEHEERTTRYIENNPAKAGLVLDPKDWRWTSARLRDGFGNPMLL